MKHQVKRSWDKLSEEERRSVKDEIIYFFEKERDEKIGIIAADEILNFMLQSFGDKLYNKGIADAKKVLENRVEDIMYELDEMLA